MFKNIFRKYFSVVSCLVLGALLLSAVTQALVSSRYWVNNKREMLSQNAETVAEFLSDNAVRGPSNNYYLPDSLSPAIRHLASIANEQILITDKDFQILLCSEDGACPHRGKVLPDTTQQTLKNNNYFTVDKLGNLYTDTHYTVCVPLQKDGPVMGYVLVSARADDMLRYIGDNLRVSLVCGLAVLMVVFVVLYILTYRMVRPLKQMAIATRQFSQGNFSYRVRVKGQDEVAELATALNGMATSLSSEEDARRSFVANVSHELKTPMTTIAGFVDGILDGTIPPEKHDHYLQIVSDEIKRLSRLVRAMLNLSRIESGELTLHPTSFDLTELIGTSLITFEQTIDKKDLAIEGLEDCGPLTVNGDYDLLQQAVYNLVENAVKFTNEGGTISFRISQQDGHVVCVIRNTGDGIPSTELPHIFERFYKSDRSRSIDKTGTGLGLYLVKCIVDLHGGEIAVRSVEHEYCEFFFRLPNTR